MNSIYLIGLWWLKVLILAKCLEQCRAHYILYKCRFPSQDTLHLPSEKKYSQIGKYLDYTSPLYHLSNIFKKEEKWIIVRDFIKIQYWSFGGVGWRDDSYSLLLFCQSGSLYGFIIDVESFVKPIWGCIFLNLMGLLTSSIYRIKFYLFNLSPFLHLYFSNFSWHSCDFPFFLWDAIGPVQVSCHPFSRVPFLCMLAECFEIGLWPDF